MQKEERSSSFFVSILSKFQCDAKDWVCSTTVEFKAKMALKAAWKLYGALAMKDLETYNSKLIKLLSTTNQLDNYVVICCNKEDQ